MDHYLPGDRRAVTVQIGKEQRYSPRPCTSRLDVWYFQSYRPSSPSCKLRANKSLDIIPNDKLVSRRSLNTKTDRISKWQPPTAQDAIPDAHCPGVHPEWVGGTLHTGYLYCPLRRKVGRYLSLLRIWDSGLGRKHLCNRTRECGTVVLVQVSTYHTKISIYRAWLTRHPFGYRDNPFGYRDTPPQFAHCNSSFSLNIFIQLITCHGADGGIQISVYANCTSSMLRVIPFLLVLLVLFMLFALLVSCTPRAPRCGVVVVLSGIYRRWEERIRKISNGL